MHKTNKTKTATITASLIVLCILPDATKDNLGHLQAFQTVVERVSSEQPAAAPVALLTPSPEVKAAGGGLTSACSPWRLGRIPPPRFGTRQMHTRSIPTRPPPGPRHLPVCRAGLRQTPSESVLTPPLLHRWHSCGFASDIRRIVRSTGWHSGPSRWSSPKLEGLNL